MLKWPRIVENSSRIFELYDPEYSYKVEMDRFRQEPKAIVSLIPIFEVLSQSLPHYCILVVDVSATLCEETKKRIKELIEIIRNHSIPFIVAVNKVECVNTEERKAFLKSLKEIFD